MRKELDEITQNNSPTAGFLPPYGNWIKNLRSTKNKIFPATTYLNCGESSCPYYVPVRVKKEKCIEILRDPNSTSKIDIKLIKGNKEILKSNFSDIKSMNTSTINFMQSLNNTNMGFDISSTFKKSSSVGSFKICKGSGSGNMLVIFFLNLFISFR